MDGEKDNALEMNITQLSSNPSIPQLYFNGFGNAVTNGDGIIVLTKNGIPIAVLNASYSCIKTLAIKLKTMVDEFEQTTGNQIMPIDFIESKLHPKAK